MKRKHLLIAAVVIGLVILGKLVSKEKTTASTTPPPQPTIAPVPQKKWSEKTYEEKEAAIKDFIKSDQDAKYILIAQIKEKLEEAMNGLEDLDFNPSPILDNSRIVDAETGVVFIEGTASGKNFMKYKVKGTYSVRWRYSDTLVQVEKATFSPFE